MELCPNCFVEIVPYSKRCPHCTSFIDRRSFGILDAMGLAFQIVWAPAIVLTGFLSYIFWSDITFGDVFYIFVGSWILSFIAILFFAIRK
jgi:hypothetical protein